jgi:predicted amidohydrolase
MKVAAYQMPLLPSGSIEAALSLIRERVAWCEVNGVSILCCPEAILGGLADDCADPQPLAMSVHSEQFDTMLAPLASDMVTTIVGFTERADDGRLYNAAAVFASGAIVGVYRKQHPAINRSVYAAGRQLPVFEAGGLRFGIVICYDSNFPNLARSLAERGAAALFVPSNNALPDANGGRELVTESRRVDIATAMANRLWVIRADVAGRRGDLVSYGSSAIVDPSGTVVQSARELSDDMIVAEL